MPRQSKISWHKELKTRSSLFSLKLQKTLRRDFNLSDSGIKFLTSRLKGIIIYGHPPYLTVLPAVFEPKEGARIINSALKDLQRLQKVFQKIESSIADLKFLNRSGIADSEVLRFLSNRLSETKKQIDLSIISLGLLRNSKSITPIVPGAIGENKRWTALQPHEQRKLFVDACLDCRQLEGLHIGYTSSGNKERGGATSPCVATD